MHKKIANADDPRQGTWAGRSSQAKSLYGKDTKEQELRISGNFHKSAWKKSSLTALFGMAGRTKRL